jgi:hypothetical protein
MKTLQELIKISNEINSVISAEEAEILIAGGSAFLCGPDGSVDEEEAAELIAAGEPVTLNLDLEMHLENGRTMNEKGRAELAAEEAAMNRVIAKARELGCELVDDGVGSGSKGSISCWLLK